MLKSNGRLEGDRVYKFIRLNRKTYRTKFDLKMFICR